MKICVVIPVYNHELAIPKVLSQLKPYGLKTVLVNDGSSAECTAALVACVEPESDWVSLLHLPINQGKGAAVMQGLEYAEQAGFSHVLQIDADGQHDPQDVPKFLASSRQQPNALILGAPIFSAEAPKSRLYGRYLTNVWIWINTLSFAIQDAMCGFRIYPLEAVNQLRAKTTLTQRMDFDIEIAVRLYWQGLEVINIPTKVSYPYDGVSHFQLWRDNFRISKIHARLFLAMWPQLFKLLKRR